MHGSDVMVPGHPRWIEFIDALSQAAICRRNTANAERVLATMGGIDVPASIDALRVLDGRCDCEIVFEVGELQFSGL